MTDAAQRWDDLDSLLDRVLDGLQSEDNIRQINHILRTDLEAWRRFVSYMGLHGRLVWGEGLAAEIAMPMGEAVLGNASSRDEC